MNALREQTGKLLSVADMTLYRFVVRLKSMCVPVAPSDGLDVFL